MKDKEYLYDFLVLVAAGSVIFYRSLDIYFVSDNIGHIENAAKNIFDFNYYYFRPVTIFSLFADRLFWGPNPQGYHLTNLLLHILNSLLLYIFARQLINNRFFALTTSFLFLLHPIHSLPLFWISGRTDMICSLFYLATLVLFVQYYQSRKRKYTLLAYGGFLLSLLSKEMAVSLPLVLIVYVLIFDNTVIRERVKKSLKMSYPYFLILAVFVAVRFLFVSEEFFSNKDHVFTGIIQLVKNFSVAAGLLVVPGGHIEIAAFLKSNPVIFTLLSVTSLLILFFSLRWVVKSQPLLFSILFVIVTLLPVIRLIMRWYLYIPSVGFCLAAGYLLYRLYISDYGKKYKLSFVLTGIILLIFAFFIHIEQNRWITAGGIAKELTSKISKTIVERDIDNCVLLNLPGEIAETPIIIYGLQPFINFRLEHEFDHPKPVRIEAVSYISLNNKKDLSNLDIQKTGPGSYILSLRSSQACFIFPTQSEIYSKRIQITRGLLLENDIYTGRVESINNRHEANEISIALKERDRPVLYFLNRQIHVENGDMGALSIPGRN